MQLCNPILIRERTICIKYCFNEDGLGAIVNSSRGIIAAYKKDAYAKFGPEHFADASRQAVIDMIADIGRVL